VTVSDTSELQLFISRLGAALNDSGQPVHDVQQQLTAVTLAYGVPSARISAFPTFMLVSMGQNEPATVELAGSLAAFPRLDQIAALDELVHEASRGAVSPGEGIRRLDEIHDLVPRFGHTKSIVGYAILAVGLCLILQPVGEEVAASAVFGAVVGLLRSTGRNNAQLQTLMPVLAAFVVSALAALAVRTDFATPGVRSLVASLVVFLPGAALTNAILELAAGQMISGASRLVSAVVQLLLLAFGILAGIQAVGVPSSEVLTTTDDLLAPWVAWIGVLLFAIGVMVADSAPRRSFLGLITILYAAWAGQLVGNLVFGGYVSALVGAFVMTCVARWVSRFPSTMPPYACFLPGFWLLVPGALGLIGVTKLATDVTPATTQDVASTVISVFAVAIGVLFGTLMLDVGSSVFARRR
jgi:uncharacterized membrane protein YjjP (DUF1212 family)